MKTLFTILIIVAYLMIATKARAQKNIVGYEQICDTREQDDTDIQFNIWDNEELFELEDEEEQNDPVALYDMGKSLAYYDDYEEAIACFRKAAEMGNADAQSELGALYYNGTYVDQDYDEAVKWFILSADQECAKAQYNLGLCYYWGFGVEHDFNKAVKLLRKAAAQKDEYAIEFLIELKCYSI